MIWRPQWKAISDQIQGLLEAGRLYLECQSIRREDPYRIATNVLKPQAQEVFNALMVFDKTHQDVLPSSAALSLKRFIDRWQPRFIPSTAAAAEQSSIEQSAPQTIVQVYLTALASFRSEFTYHISDFSAIARRLSERAFTHLQRSIIADPDLRERWKRAFERGEPACEQLGAVHLLLHGIWAFKANAEGERTDLVLGEPLMDLAEAQTTADALVLTEWKLVRTERELQEKITQAHVQAARYAGGSLAGFELAQYRYLVMVSEKNLHMPPDLPEGETIYRQINIAVNPKSPSRS